MIPFETALRSNGIDVRVDRWEMEMELRAFKRVLVVGDGNDATMRGAAILGFGFGLAKPTDFESLFRAAHAAGCKCGEDSTSGL